MKALIGLAGFAQVGKDTAAGFAVEVGYTKLAFADGVRLVAERLNPYIQPGVMGTPLFYNELLTVFGYENAKNRFPRMRDALVDIGAGLREILGPDVWVRRVEDQLLAMPDDALVIISDVRYANEAEMIRRHGGQVWMIVRPGYGPANDEEAWSLAGIEPDLVIENNGTIDELRSHLIE